MSSPRLLISSARGKAGLRGGSVPASPRSRANRLPVFNRPSCPYLFMFLQGGSVSPAPRPGALALAARPQAPSALAAEAPLASGCDEGEAARVRLLEPANANSREENGDSKNTLRTGERLREKSIPGKEEELEQERKEFT